MKLLDRELFGHVKGSFTGAGVAPAWLVEAAAGGTLFLDQIGEMPAAMQVKLLQFLNHGSYQPLGGREPRHADVRIVAAASLYDRLTGVVLRRAAGPQARFTPVARRWLNGLGWRGNVSELRAAVECAAALAPTGATGLRIDAPDLAVAVGEDASAAAATASYAMLNEEVATLERAGANRPEPPPRRRRTRPLARWAAQENESHGAALKRDEDPEGDVRIDFGIPLNLLFVHLRSSYRLRQGSKH